MPLSVGNLLMGSASQPMMSAIASSYASGKQDALTFGYDGSVISSIDGSAIAGGGGGDTSQCFPATASSMLQPSGNYLSSTDASAFYPSTANPSGYATTEYVDSSISGFAYESSVSAWTAKQDALTFGYSGSYISSINGSAIANTTAGGVVTATGGENGYVTSINGSGLSGAAGGGGGGDTSQCLPKSASSDFILTSQSSQFITSTAGLQPSGDYQTAGDYAYNSSLSGYLQASASGDFITSTAGLQPSGDYAYSSALSSYLPKSASGDFAPSGDYAYNSALSAYAYESSVSAWTAKQDALTFGYSGSYISSINGSAIADTTAGGVVTATGGSDGYVTSINGSGLSGAGGGGGGLTTANLIVDSANMTASSTVDGIQIGTKGAVVQIISDVSEATGLNVVYVVLGG